MVWIGITRGKNGGGMRVIHNLRFQSASSRYGGQWLLALGLAITPWFAATSWADNFKLDSVDFASTGDQTRIMLHTGSIVPVQKVSVSDTKMVLEIDQVNTDDTVRTNFSGAANISHVIMQPINEHKVRMIIRGENMAPPTVAFYNANSNAYANANPEFQERSETLHRQTTAALKQLQDSGMQSASFNPEAEAMGTEAEPIKPAPTSKRPEAKASNQPAEDEPIAFGGLTDNSPASSLPEPDLQKPAKSSGSDKMKPLSLPSLEMPAAGNEWLDKVQSGKANNYILGALLSFIALGFGGFVIHRIMKLKNAGPDLEDLIQEQANGKRVSFKEMASAYRDKHNPVHQPENAGFASKPGNKKHHAEDVIGLRSLHQMDEEFTESQAPKPMASPRTAPPAKPQAKAPADPFGGKTPSMEQLIAMVQSVSEPKPAPVKAPPAPQKQVVSQYQKAQQAPKTKPAAKQPLDETMVREVKRAQALQQELMQQAQQQIAAAQAGKSAPKGAPLNRAVAAQKSVKPVNFKSAPATSPVNAKNQVRAAQAKAPVNNGKNGPLPGNPEVLNFLRNVADLMEKDGKPQIASSIHKNLNPRG